MAELLPEVLVGVAVHQLYSTIIRVIGSPSRFKFHLKKLKHTLDLVKTRIERIDQLIQSVGDDYTKQEIRSLILQLNKAEWLVSTCSDINVWNVYKMYKYQKRLAELDVSLTWLLRINLQTLEWNTVLPILVEVLGKNKKLDQQVLQRTETDGNAAEDNLSSSRVEMQKNSSNPEIASEGNSSRLKFYWSYDKKDKHGETHFKIDFLWHRRSRELSSLGAKLDADSVFAFSNSWKKL